MSKDEIDRLITPYTKYFVNTSLLSTSTIESVAEVYHDPNKSDQVLFEIMYDPSILSRPYASVSDISSIPDDEEVLFIPGTIFERLDISSDKFWKIKLKLKYNSSLEFRYEDENRNLKNYIFQLRRVLYYNRSQKDIETIFNILIDVFSNEYLWLLAIKFDIIGQHQEWVSTDYASAIYNYQKAIDLWKDYSKTDIDANKAIVKLYNQLGYCYQRLAKQNYDQAINCGKLLVENSTTVSCDRIDILGVLSEIYETKSKIDDSDELNENILSAIKYQEQLIQHMLNDNTYNDYDIAYSLERLGRYYESVHEYNKAIHTYEHVIQKYIDQNEQDLSKLVKLHQKIAIIYSKDLKNDSQATKYQLNADKYNLESKTTN